MVRTLAGSLVLALGFAGNAAARVERVAAPTPQQSAATGATFVISGHGWGHGIGMSQYGAFGYARRGVTYDRILAHYYPGIALGPAPVSRVRVLLAQGRRTLTVSSIAPFRVTDALGKSYRLTAGPHAFGPGLRLRLDPASDLQVLQGPLLFVPGAAPLELDRPYRGQLQVGVTDGRLQAVNVVGLEGYLSGVVPSEMPYTWPLEALKAQAVVARSYALATRRSGAFDLYSDTRSQVYRGLEAERPSTNAAAAATAGQVVLYAGQIAHTYFFSTSGGRTAAVTDVWPNAKPVPYLVSVDDPFDNLSPWHDWGPFDFTATTLGRRLHVPGRLLDLRPTPSSSGRVRTVTAVGTLGQMTVAGSDFRRLFGLRSTWFGIGVLQLTVPVDPIVYGSTARLTGTARGLTGLQLQQRSGPSGWATVSAVAPAKDGTFAVTAKPQVTTTYRLAGGGTTGAAVRVRVAPLVRFSPVRTATSLRGLERPIFPGSTVQIQRLDASGSSWPTVATATVTAAGDFEAQLKLTPGSYRARVAPGHGFAPGTTAVLQVVAQ